jgi:hypothetical protein
MYVSACVEGYLIFTALSENILLPELCLKEFFLAAGNYGTLFFISSKNLNDCKKKTFCNILVGPRFCDHLQWLVNGVNARYFL